ALLGEEEGSLHIISSLPPAPQIAYNDSLPVALRAACIQRLVDTYKLLGDGAKSQALARHLVALRDPDARTASHYSPTLGIVAGLLGLDAVRPDPALVRSILVFNKT
ncbi:MAG: hypothetical protein KDK78_01340, partial [Chlamydiia bacterium]|nr:hypothetical protein [Chlamydiia bacterium]